MIVIDPGGTVDVTAHLLSDDGTSVREILPPSGGPWGSCNINDNYELLLERIFSSDVLNEFKAKNPAAFGMFQFDFLCTCLKLCI